MYGNRISSLDTFIQESLFFRAFYVSESDGTKKEKMYIAC